MSTGDTKAVNAPMSGDGDGWVFCDSGHRHWGLFGAAGLLISDGEHAILQHRAPWTHEGGTWGLPGGARDSHEDPMSTALREADEEAAIAPTSVEPIALWIDDHGGWSYTTVLARPTTAIVPRAANAESTDVRWWPHTEIDGLSLHQGLAATWPHVRRPPLPVSIIVDSRSDRRFVALLAGVERDRLDRLIRYGLPVAALPGRLSGAGLPALLVSITLVGEPTGDPGGQSAPGAGWWRRAVRVIEPTTDAGAGVLLAAAACAALHQVVVVTVDETVNNGLAQAAPNGSAVGPDWLAEQLDRPRFG